MPHSLDLQFGVSPCETQVPHGWLQRDISIRQDAVGHAGLQRPSAFSSISGASLRVEDSSTPH